MSRYVSLRKGESSRRNFFCVGVGGPEQDPVIKNCSYGVLSKTPTSKTARAFVRARDVFFI